ncbi:MAG: MFS transporter, partial [Actinomycetota bacterium]|nr:MFS transporter [Actinomycetota bacterium]
MRLPGGLWRHRDFVWLWSSQTVSQFGSQISQLALPLVAIVVLEESAFRVALLGVVEFLPFLLLSLPAGVWVDRLRRRPILVVADVLRAAALASIPIAYWLGALTIWQLYVVGFVVGIGTVFFDVAYQSYLPALVAREELTEGNSKLEVSRAAAQLGGPGAAGLLIGILTAPVAVVADAISFVVSALLIGRIRTVEPQPVVEDRRSLVSELREGLGYVIRHPYIRGMAASVAIFNFFGNVGGAILLVYAVRDLGLSATTIGVVLALGNIGFLAGALVAKRVETALGVGRTIVASMALSAPGMLLIPAAPRDLAVPFIVLSGLIIGFAVVLYNVTAISLMQAITPDRLLGRMNASRRFLVWGVIPLGGLTGGALATTIGLRPTLFVGAIGASLAVLPLLFSPVRSLERVPEAEEPETSPPIEP